MTVRSNVARVSAPPPTGDAALDAWLRSVHGALASLPFFSFVSGNPATSGLSSAIGGLVINVASGTTSVLWINTSGATNGWRPIL